MTDKYLREKIMELLDDLEIGFIEGVSNPNESTLERIYGKDIVADSVLSLFHASRREWLEKIVPHVHTKFQQGELYDSFDDGFNACRSQILRNADEKEKE